jgi:hypothetical protein
VEVIYCPSGASHHPGLVLDKAGSMKFGFCWTKQRSSARKTSESHTRRCPIGQGRHLGRLLQGLNRCEGAKSALRRRKKWPLLTPPRTLKSATNT